MATFGGLRSGFRRWNSVPQLQKTCTRCKVTKDPSDFHKRKSGRDGLHAWCRDCHSQIGEESYKKTSVKKALSRNRARRTAEARTVVRAAKDNPCVDCGRRGPYYCFDFDHRPDEVKLFEISKLRTFSLSRILAEIAKCDLVCAWCHRVRTHERMMAAKSGARVKAEPAQDEERAITVAVQGRQAPQLVLDL